MSFTPLAVFLYILNCNEPAPMRIRDSGRQLLTAGETMQDTLKPPYVRKVGQRGNITIWVVDGTYVRTQIDEEFTNYAQHYAFKFIPEREFWLDQEAAEDEQQFFIDHLLVEYDQGSRSGSSTVVSCGACSISTLPRGDTTTSMSSYLMTKCG